MSSSVDPLFLKTITHTTLTPKYNVKLLTKDLVFIVDVFDNLKEVTPIQGYLIQELTKKIVPQLHEDGRSTYAIISASRDELFTLLFFLGKKLGTVAESVRAWHIMKEIASALRLNADKLLDRAQPIPEIPLKNRKFFKGRKEIKKPKTNVEELALIIQSLSPSPQTELLVFYNAGLDVKLISIPTSVYENPELDVNFVVENVSRPIFLQCNFY